MKKYIVLIVSILLLLPGEGFAVDPNPQGELEVIVLMSNTPKYIYEWVNTGHETDIHIEPLKAVMPGVMCYMAVVVTGFALDSNGLMNVDGGFALVNPDGSVQFDRKKAFLMKKTIEHPAGFIMLDPAIDLSFDKSDQLGEYLIRADVTDYISGKSASSEYKIAVYDKSSLKEASEIVTYYYKSLQPNKLIPALKIFLSINDILKDEVHFGPIKHFFSVVAHNDQEFLVQLKKLKNEYTHEREEAIKEIIVNAETFVSPEATSAKNLDYLWMEYYATGQKEPIIKIINAFELEENRRNILIIGAAEWSLKNNALQHTDVYDICRQVLPYTKGKTYERLTKVIAEVGKGKNSGGRARH